MEVLLAHFAAADAFLLQQYFGENDNPKQPELETVAENRSKLTSLIFRLIICLVISRKSSCYRF